MHYLKKLTKLNQRGDTILEVLISVAILSLILTSSFALANRSSIANRQAAERGEASKTGQSEIEKLKFYLSSPGAPSPTNGTYFCVDTSNATAPTLIPVTITAGTVDTAYNTIPNGCKKGTDQRYATFIYREPLGAQQNTYTTYVRWDSLSGRGADKINLVHRVYPDEASNLINVANSGAIGFTPPTFTISGNIRASGDNYTGWPIMEATFNWSDGTSDVQSWAVNQAHGSGVGTYNFSFTKSSTVTLTSLSARMTNDAYGASPGQDRNLYIHDYTVVGQGTYPHTSAVESGCSHAPFYYNGSDAKFLCSNYVVNFYPGMVSKYGNSVNSCTGTIPSFPCNYDPFNAPGYTLTAFNCTNFAATYSFVNAGRNLHISYGDNIGCSTAPSPATSSTGYRYQLNIYVNGSLNQTVSADAFTSNYEGIRSINLGSSIPVGATVRLEWTNNMWVPSDANPVYDPDFAIYRVGVAP